MQMKGIKSGLMIVAVSLLVAEPAAAFDFGNMMNPSKWMGGNKDRDRYDDDYYGGPGYGYGGPGYGYGGYGAPGYGYVGYGAAPGYGYGGAPAAGATGGGSRDAEIQQLKERLRQLEGEVR